MENSSEQSLIDIRNFSTIPIELLSKIESLQSEVENLVRIGDEMQKKIFDAYLLFAPERELLKELIIAKFGYSKSEKQQLPSFKFLMEFSNKYSELVNKRGEEITDKVDIILSDCDQLATWKVELDKKRNIVEEAKNIIVNINTGNISVGEGHVLIGTTIEGNADFRYATTNNLLTDDLRNLEELLLEKEREIEREKLKREEAEERIKKNNSERKKAEKEAKLTSFQESTRLIKRQKEKIINAYLRFFPEKKLLKELINVHLDFTKTKKQKLNFFMFDKERNELLKKLTEKIGEEQMENVELALNDCEDLVDMEIEIENKINSEGLTDILNDVSFDINEINIIRNVGNINFNQGHAFIGNTFGNNTNLSYANNLSYQIEIPPKSN